MKIPKIKNKIFNLENFVEMMAHDNRLTKSEEKELRKIVEKLYEFVNDYAALKERCRRLEKEQEITDANWKLD